MENKEAGLTVETVVAQRGATTSTINCVPEIESKTGRDVATLYPPVVIGLVSWGVSKLFD